MGNNQSSSSGSSHSTTPSRSRAQTTNDHQPQGQVVANGTTYPQSHIYASSTAEYSRPTVHKLILDRKLAPFHLGLNDFEDDWDVDQVIAGLGDGERQATQNLRDAHVAAVEATTEAETTQMSAPPGTRKAKEAAALVAAAVLHRERLGEVIKQREKRNPTGGIQGINKLDLAKMYLGKAVECPICFLYYPPPLVHTRCCDQPICTECFVQIRRAEPTATHLESEPAACPFCMEVNFGCVFLREPTTTGRPTIQPSASHNSAGSSGFSEISNISATTSKPRRKSFAHTEKEVVTTDQLYPDWEAKLEAVKATAARRANRRIVFRQVGDRLIPVGVTSGRAGDGANATMSTTQLPPGFAAQVAAAMDASTSGRGSRSSRRRNQEMAAYLETMGVGVGQDLEEMMVEEAMRLSMLEDEERQKKEREEKEKAVKANGGATARDSSPAETSAQGASRTGPEVAATSTATAALLSDAIDAPIGSSSSPVLPSSSSSPSSAPVPNTRHGKNASSASVGALAAGSLAALSISPGSSPAFPRPGEATDAPSISRGVVGAGLTAATTSRTSPSPPSQPSLPRLPTLDLGAPTSTLETVPDLLISTDDSSSPPPHLEGSTPLTLSSSVASVASVASSSFSVDQPISPSAGYQQLEDNDDEEEGTRA